MVEEVVAITMASTIGEAAVAIMIIGDITTMIEEVVVSMEEEVVVIIEMREGTAAEGTIEIIDQEIMTVTIVVGVGKL